MTDTHPANAPPRDVIAEAIEAIEAKKRDIQSEHMEYMRRVRPLHEDIADIVDEAKRQHGVRPKVLKVEIARRDHLRKADAAPDKLTDDEDVAQYDYLRTVFGDDADLPLFSAAADAHEAAVKEAKAPKRKRKTAAGLAAEKNADLDEMEGQGASA
jgi:hypothetical protein